MNHFGEQIQVTEEAPSPSFVCSMKHFFYLFLFSLALFCIKTFI